MGEVSGRGRREESEGVGEDLGGGQGSNIQHLRGMGLGGEKVLDGHGFEHFFIVTGFIGIDEFIAAGVADFSRKIEEE